MNDHSFRSPGVEQLPIDPALEVSLQILAQDQHARRGGVYRGGELVRTDEVVLLPVGSLATAGVAMAPESSYAEEYAHMRGAYHYAKHTELGQMQMEQMLRDLDDAENDSDDEGVKKKKKSRLVAA